MNWILIVIIIYLVLLAGSIGIMLRRTLFYIRNPDIVEQRKTKPTPRILLNLRAFFMSMVIGLSQTMIVVVVINMLVALGLVIWLIVTAIND